MTKANDDIETSMGFCEPSVRLSEPLGPMSSVFQAELYVIEMCAMYCLTGDDLNGWDVTIFSDSQTALRALGSTTVRLKLVLDSLNVLRQFSLTCNLTLCWVPGPIIPFSSSQLGLVYVKFIQ